MKFEEIQYIGYDGLRMHSNLWMPDNERPRAILIAIHGLGSYGYTLKNIGEYFGERGFAVFAPDMRGFGRYTELKGHIMNYGEYIEDMHNIVMQAKDRFLNRLTFLFGHSLGAIHILRYLDNYPIEVDGMILSCPAVSETLPISKATRIAGWFLSLLNVKRYFDAEIDYKYSSHDSEVVKAHENDPLMFDQVTARFGMSALKAKDKAFQSAERITLPVFIQQAGDDKLVDPEKTKDFFDRLGSPDKTFKQYEGLYHELHAEVEKEKVLADMNAWLEKRLPV
ncbi:MAG: alpha/beta fold hydrolase [Candidatus Lokiarchaeota archaeon]|nr:alpha/beta fold hydrolase [Candidatus Lokiarchaeota archaeon]